MSITLIGSCSPQKEHTLTSVCGFDFSRIDWKNFNEDSLLKLYGIGCGYQPDEPARKHVFYDSKDNEWIQFDVIENDKWIIAITVSKKPLCDKAVQPLHEITSCGLVNGLRIGNTTDEVERIYGGGNKTSDMMEYRYYDIGIGANVYFGKNNTVTGYKIFSLFP